MNTFLLVQPLRFAVLQMVPLVFAYIYKIQSPYADRLIHIIFRNIFEMGKNGPTPIFSCCGFSGVILEQSCYC